MKEFDVDNLDLIRSELAKNLQTENTAMYSLLLRKHLREGGESIADPLSSIFCLKEIEKIDKSVD